MAALNAREFLQKQEAQYNKHQQVIKKAENTVKHQYQIKANGIIPKKHRPKPPVVVNEENSRAKCTQSFQKEYNKLFFKSIDKAISLNTITIELEKARSSEITRRTEQVLCLSSEPSTLLLKLYKEFLERIDLSNHEISQELRVKLTTAPAHCSKKPSTEKTKQTRQNKKKTLRHTSVGAQKRKEAIPHPPATKQLKLDHFLVKGQKQATKPT